MKLKKTVNKSGSSFGLNRRTFIASAVSGSSLLLPSLRGLSGVTNPDIQAGTAATAIDFDRSFCHCIPKPGSIWVRIQIECRCEVFDRASGGSDEYILGVRAQTGLHKEPAGDPGYDFWVIFSKKYVYNKRVHTSSYNNNPNRVPVDQYGPIGWHVQSCAATPIHSAEEFRKALQAWKRISARSVFTSADGSRGFAIEYPVKWADANLKTDTFRVETGPVILLEQDRARVGTNLEFEDFQWAYLDYHSLDQVRCFLERPTSILSNVAYTTSSSTPSPNPVLTVKQVDQIEKRLFSGWKPPISISGLQKLFQTNHYSAITHIPVTTSLYALDQPCPVNT
jgi:hypothetical protein